MEIHPEVAPEPDDILVTKRRISAFAGSDLDLLLRADDFDQADVVTVADRRPPTFRRGALAAP